MPTSPPSVTPPSHHRCDPKGPGGLLTESRVYRLMLVLIEIDWTDTTKPPAIGTSQRAAALLAEIGNCGDCMWNVALFATANVVRYLPDKADAAEALQDTIALLLDRIDAEDAGG